MRPFYPLAGGGSNNLLYRISDIVKKDLGTKEDTEHFKDWIDDNNGKCLYPEVIGYINNDVYMDFIYGRRLCDDFSSRDLFSIIKTIEDFSSEKRNRFNIDIHLDNLNSNRDGSEIDKIINICEQMLKSLEAFLIKNASYSHGDMILSNIIKKDEKLFFLDPRYFKNSSTYLWDLGKLRMSLMNYEKRFGISIFDNSRYMDDLDDYLYQKNIYKPVLIITLMHICRLYKYKPESQKHIVVNMAKEVLFEIERTKYGICYPFL